MADGRAQRHPAGEPDPRTGGRPAQQQPAGAPVRGAAASRSRTLPIRSRATASRQARGSAAAGLPLSAAAAAAPVCARRLRLPRQSSGVEQPRQRAQCPADARFRQLPAHAAAAVRAAAPAGAAARPQQSAPPADRDPIHAAGGYRQMPPQAAPQHGAPQYAPRAPQPSYDQWPAPAQPSHHAYEPGSRRLPPVRYAVPRQQQSPRRRSAAAGGLGHARRQLRRSGARAGLRPRRAGYDQQQHGGALEPTYGQEEAGGYEVEEPRRVSWTMRIAGAVVVAIGLGYGLAQAYKAVLGGPAPDGATPVVASDATPAKEKPLDPGGKQFSHTDSKVLGRLGDGGSAAEEQLRRPVRVRRQQRLAQSDDARGRPRWVDCAAGGRCCRAPPPPAERGSVSVPGLTVVDAFGSAAPRSAAGTPA